MMALCVQSLFTRGARVCVIVVVGKREMWSP
jgi:hypothetical protein